MEAKVVLIPVPWEATTSYGGGTSDGPKAIVAASHQLDLDDGYYGKIYRAGLAMIDECDDIRTSNHAARIAAERVMEGLCDGTADDRDLNLVNQASARVNDWVYRTAKGWLEKGKLVGVVGGDHSVPFGAIKALGEKHSDGFGVLHIDAHHDLRVAYEGFEHSHASIHYNVMEQCSAVTKLVQVAIRDYCAEEKQYLKDLGARGAVFYQADIFRKKAEGAPFVSICNEIVSSLPKKVYISFDIDGLDPVCCPNTGTPVPGGLSFEEGVYLLEKLAESGRTVIGFDLCEVSPGKQSEWDANVGCRILYKLCGALLRSQGVPLS
jgi:agmatinase